jgi:hypothetical protein
VFAGSGWRIYREKKESKRMRTVRACVFAVCGLMGAARTCAGYSVQTHEQMIDPTWRASIAPFLRARFPAITPGELREAHAYAYGGAAIQDLGYYPFGNKYFSNLAHYVRSGDFVRAMLEDARTPEELAFAVGALSHYVGDSIGHSMAVNPSVAIEFPKLGKKYGPKVTYEEGEHQHVRTEFAFDVNEISKGRFAPSAYLKSVGLSISEDLMARAFYDTYGLNLYGVLGKRGRAMVDGYRFSVRRFLPRIAYAEAVLHRSRFPEDEPGPAIQELTAELKQADFENGWDKFRKHAGVGTYTLAGVIVILPKVGVLSDLAIRGPAVDTEEKYVESVLAATQRLRDDLRKLGTVEDVRGTEAEELLPNRDLDTGAKVRPGGYRLTDETYARLLGEVVKEKAVPAGLKVDILEYYADPNAPIATKKNPKAWAKVQAELRTLQGMPMVDGARAAAVAGSE